MQEKQVTVVLYGEELGFYELRTRDEKRRYAFAPLREALLPPQRVGALLAEQIAAKLRALALQPESVLCDLYPKYPTSYAAEQLSEQYDLPVRRLQHCDRTLRTALEEMQQQGVGPSAGARVFGVCLDRPSFGSDGTLWGGELLELTDDGFTRLASIHPYQLIGTNMELCSARPRETAVSMLYDLARMQHPEDEAIRDFVAKQAASRQTHQLQLCGLNDARAQYIAQDRHKSTTRTTAASGLLDAAAAILGLCGDVTPMGETPVEALAATAAAFTKNEAAEQQLQALEERCRIYVQQAAEAEDPTLESDDLWEDTDDAAFLENDGAAPDILHTEQLIRILAEERCRYLAAEGTPGGLKKGAAKEAGTSPHPGDENARLLAFFFLHALPALFDAYLGRILSEEEKKNACILLTGALPASASLRPYFQLPRPNMYVRMIREDCGSSPYHK